MGDVTTLPVHGEAFLDDRGDDRALRVSWHDEASVVVLSLWRHEFCVGTFRLRAADVPTMIAVLSASPEQHSLNGHNPTSDTDRAPDEPAS